MLLSAGVQLSTVHCDGVSRGCHDAAHSPGKLFRPNTLGQDGSQLGLLSLVPVNSHGVMCIGGTGHRSTGTRGCRLGCFAVKRTPPHAVVNAMKIVLWNAQFLQQNSVRVTAAAHLLCNCSWGIWSSACALLGGFRVDLLYGRKFLVCFGA